MASFQDVRSGAESRGAASRGKGGDSDVKLEDFEKLKARVSEVENIIVSQGLTMKKLGEEEDVDGGTTKKSLTKLDKDWTSKVEAKLQKMNSTIMGLTNKVTDINNGFTQLMVDGIAKKNQRRSQSLLHS